MPKFDHPNHGDISKYVYEYGVVVTVYAEDDTVDITINGEQFDGIPLYYHCTHEAAARSNGALFNAASAFSEEDNVLVRCVVGENGTVTPVSVIGFAIVPKKCLREYLIFGLQKSTVDGETKYCIVWDIASQCMAPITASGPLEISSAEMVEWLSDKDYISSTTAIWAWDSGGGISLDPSAGVWVDENPIGEYNVGIDSSWGRDLVDTYYHNASQTLYSCYDHPDRPSHKIFTTQIKQNAVAPAWVMVPTAPWNVATWHSSSTPYIGVPGLASEGLSSGFRMECNQVYTGEMTCDPYCSYLLGGARCHTVVSSLDRKYTLTMHTPFSNDDLLGYHLHAEGTVGDMANTGSMYLYGTGQNYYETRLYGAYQYSANCYSPKSAIQIYLKNHSLFKRDFINGPVDNNWLVDQYDELQVHAGTEYRPSGNASTHINPNSMARDTALETAIKNLFSWYRTSVLGRWTIGTTTFEHDGIIGGGDFWQYPDFPNTTAFYSVYGES